MKKLLFAIIASATALCGNAQLLWKVTGNGAKDASYLFGTHHVAPYTMMDSVSGFNDALKSVDVVMGEIDMISLDQAAMQQATLGMALAPADSLLTMVLTPEQIDSVDAVLAKYSGGQLTTRALAPMKPMMVTTMLAMFQSMAVFPDFDQTKQLDTMVQDRAKNAGKAIAGLETIEEQLGFLFGTPIALQAEQLMESVRNDGESGKMALELSNAYTSQNLDKVHEILTAESADESEQLKRLLDDRNMNWVAKLNEILPQKSVLVAVGCGHLPGPNGLIELLRAKGYTVAPL